MNAVYQLVKFSSDLNYAINSWQDFRREWNFLRYLTLPPNGQLNYFDNLTNSPDCKLTTHSKITLRCNKRRSERKIQEPYFGSWNILHPVSSAEEASFFVPRALNALFLLRHPVGASAGASSRLSDIVEDAKDSPVSSRFIFMFALSQSPLASHSDVFRGSSRVPSGVGTRDEPLRTSAWEAKSLQTRLSRLPLRRRESCISKSGEHKGATWPS